MRIVFFLLYITMENNKTIEQNEVDVILQNGFSFDLPTKSFISAIMRKKTRKIEIKPFSMGVEALMTDEWVKLKYDVDGGNKFAQLISDNTDLHCEALAIAYLGRRWKIALFKGVVKRYFKYRITPKILLATYTYLMALCDIRNFTLATILVTDVNLMSPKKGNTVA